MAKASYELLADIRNSIEDVLTKMLHAKKEGKGSTNLRELLTEASVMFVDLRQVNRMILQEEDRVKSETDAAKLPVDHTTLQLHNLLYEKNYYLKAIKACKDFKSKYPDIDLVSEEEFFRDASEELKGDPSLKEDPHKLNLQRLNFELHQRKELCRQKEQLDARKKLLQEGIANRRKFLSSLPNHLKALKKASLPVQQHLGILHTKRVKQHQLAELLPTPLYILYSQFLSQKEAFGEAIELEILGSVKEAQTVARQLANRETTATTPGGATEETKLEDDLHDDDDEFQRRRKRVKKSHDKEIPEGPGLYQAHPLSILLQIYDDEQLGTDKPNKLLAVSFEFLPRLNIVGAGIDGTSQATESANLLANLFPNDTGLDLPNQVSKLQAGVGFVFDEKRPLRPYKWAQHLAGIDFLPESPPLIPDSGASVFNEAFKGGAISSTLAAYRQQRRVFSVLQQLRTRKKAHLALKEQLESLAKLKLPSLQSSSFPWVAHVPKCTLRAWAEVEASGQDHTLVALVGTDLQAGNTAALSKEIVVAGTPADLEAGREDGELPSSAAVPTATPGGSGSKPSNGNGGTEDHSASPMAVEGSGKESLKLPSRSGVGEKRSRRERGSAKLPTVQKEEVILSGIHAALLPGLDALMDDGMDGLDGDASMEEVGDDANPFKREWGWETYGVERYRAVLRRDGGQHGKRLELEAQVEVGPEYPLRPPVFHLQLLTSSGNKESAAALPPAPPGLLDVTEASVIGEPKVEEWFNELRALEAEVNNHLPGTIPVVEVNYTLAHQLSLLIMLFDREVDSRAPSLPGAQGPGSTQGFQDASGGKAAVRTVRGRDRRKAIAWNQKQGVFEHRS